MGKLLRFEFRKFFSSKYFYILTVVFIILLVVSGFTQKLLGAFIEVSVGGLFSIVNTPYSFAKSALSGNSFTIIAAILISIYATEDFSQTTIKNIFSKGYSRGAVFLSKYIVSLIGTILIAVISVGAAYGIGYYLFDDKTFSEDLMVLVYVILGQLLAIIAYHAIFFFISYTSRKVGLSIALNILVPLVLALIISLGDTALARQDIDFAISDYWIDNVFSNFSNLKSDEDLFVQNFITLGGYVVSFFTAGLVLNSRKEV